MKFENSMQSAEPTLSEETSGVHEIPERDERGALIMQLAAIGRLRNLTAAIRAGRLVCEYRAHMDRGVPWKPGVQRAGSFRQLSMLHGLPMSPATLCRAAGIYLLSLRMPQLVHFRNVGVGHASVVLKLSEADQVVLLTRAEAEVWTRARLMAEMDVLRRPPSWPLAGGDPRGSYPR